MNGQRRETLERDLGRLRALQAMYKDEGNLSRARSIGDRIMMVKAQLKQLDDKMNVSENT